MLERTFEIALSRYPGLIDSGWSLVGQQIGMPGGILDLLFRDTEGLLHLVEVKKGPATGGGVLQVLRYAEHYWKNGITAVPWLVANSVPAAVAATAEAAGVRTRAVTAQEFDRHLAAHGTSLSALVPLRRRTPGALTGGAGDLWRTVPDEEAFAQMAAGISALLRRLADSPKFQLKTGAMQTTIWYRGVKLGGVNRKHRRGQGYVTSGVISPSARMQLEALGFAWMEKTQSGSKHAHTWMEISADAAEAFERGLDLVRASVDRQLG